ncbi:MAG: glycosyltransferase family 4 protein [Methylococcaceae bacterium]|nr:glycosyltransferase family 4 protein [Methylococcaceae bacterium]
MNKKKVYLLQEIIPSYRVPIFKRLAQLDGIDLTVFYSRSSKAMLSENLKSAAILDGFRSVKIGLWEVGSSAYQFGICWRILLGRPDVVIAGNADCLDRLALLLVCKLLLIRVLWFQGGVPFIDEKKIQAFANRGRFNRWFGTYNPKRWLVSLADGVIAYSEHAKHYVMREEGFREEQVWVAPNSPDTEALGRYRQTWLERSEILASERKRFSPQGQNVIFLLGRLNRDRKVDVLMQALSCLHQKGLNVSLVLVGDGSERNHLESMARQLNLSPVFFEGAIYDEMELSKYFMISDIFVTPGVSSLAIKMAMFFGKPVVTVDYGLEVHDVREGHNGFIFPMDNVDILAEKLLELLQSEALSTRIGQGGIATMQDKINVGQMVEGFRQAIFAEPEFRDLVVTTDETDMMNKRN